MKKLVCLFTCILLWMSMTNEGLSQVLTATKGDRIITFQKNKKYIFHYFDSTGMPASMKAKLSFANQETLILEGRKQTIQVPVNELEKVNHYRSTGNVLGAVLQLILGPSLTISLIDLGGSGTLNTLFIISGVITTVDGILLLTGIQRSGYYGPNPSKRRGFTFEIK